MPKLRNADTDVGKLAQWIGRKLVNHAPMQEIAFSKSERSSLPSTYDQQKHKRLHQSVTASITQENVVFVEVGNRSFRVTVDELEQQSLPERVAVGH